MSIKINVPYPEKDDARQLGARWNSDEKSWIIPDSLTDINLFRRWLPKQEGYLVKRPYILLKAKRLCWKCAGETPVIALAGKSYYTLEFPGNKEQTWTYHEDPLIFLGIERLDPELTDLLTERFPFFRFTFSKTLGSKYWTNTCIHCKALQGDNYNAMMSPIDPAQAGLIEKENLPLKFDYYIISGEFYSTANHWLVT